jgi:anti-sigma factor RsiW
MDAHLERCPPCRDRLAAERAARDVLHARRDRLQTAASDVLRARCAAHATHARDVRASRLRRLVPLSLAATLLLAVGGVFLFGVNHEAVAAQLALDHMKCFDVIGEEGTRDATVAETTWLARRGWDIGVPRSSPEHNLELVGVRRCFSSDGAAAHCMYRWRDQALSVYILPRPLEVGTAEQIVEKFGHRAIIWTKSGRTYLVVTRRPGQGNGTPSGRGELESVTAYIRRSVR